MITLFNRAELLLTWDPDRFHRARRALEGAGIEHRCRVRDLASRNRGRDGALGLNREVRMEYKLVVRRDELDWAGQVLREQ